MWEKTEKKCVFCGQKFMANSSRHIYCSDACKRIVRLDKYDEVARAKRRKVFLKSKESDAIEYVNHDELDLTNNCSGSVEDEGIGINRKDTDVIKFMDKLDESFTFKHDKHYIGKASKLFKRITNLF